MKLIKLSRRQCYFEGQNLAVPKNRLTLQGHTHSFLLSLIKAFYCHRIWIDVKHALLAVYWKTTFYNKLLLVNFLNFQILKQLCNWHSRGAYINGGFPVYFTSKKTLTKKRMKAVISVINMSSCDYVIKIMEFKRSSVTPRLSVVTWETEY